MYACMHVCNSDTLTFNLIDSNHSCIPSSFHPSTHQEQHVFPWCIGRIEDQLYDESLDIVLHACATYIHNTAYTLPITTTGLWICCMHVCISVLTHALTYSHRLCCCWGCWGCPHTFILCRCEQGRFDQSDHSLPPHCLTHLSVFHHTDTNFILH
jgi:hypothetical protein